jgi:alpha-galactosidase
MRLSGLLGTATLLLVGPAVLPAAEPLPPTPTHAELKVKDAWWRDAFGKVPPFSFKYGGRSSADLLAGWAREQSTRKLDADRTEHTLTWTDPATGLVVRCVAVVYGDYPTVEWTLFFKNTGARDAPALTDVRALDTVIHREARGHEFVLHAFNGSRPGPDDYAPRPVPLPPRATARLACTRGCPSLEDLPYMNLDWGGVGLVVAIGWPGSWSAQLTRDEGTGLRLDAGMNRLDLSLKPGEEVRSPLIAVQFWEGGDWVRAQNVWRRWMVTHNLPRPGGRLPRPFTATCIDGMFPGMLSNAADEIKYLDVYLRHGVRFDYFWIDAGWYTTKTGWPNTGTWEPDPVRYPKGVKEVSDHIHEQGMKQVLWFEPERVTPGTWLYDQHPEWLLGAKGGSRLLNLGDPDAWRWAVEHFDRLIREQGVDLYRQDFNFEPAAPWASGDTPGRVGLTEIRYVTGYLAYWDELLRRHPDLLIDSCCSGGRRNDLETLRRSVPLLRSDYRFEPNGTQGHNYGISFWMPFNGTGVEPADPYTMRSHYCACFAYGGPPNAPDFDFQGRKRVADQWRRVADNFLGDYYPLTTYSLAADVWMAWQFDRPEAGTGVVQAFRRSESPYEVARLRLRGLDADAKYDLDDFDRGTTTLSGRELLDKGLEVRLDRRPDSAVISYRRAK